MKKIVCLILLLVIIFSITGCDNGNSEYNETESSENISSSDYTEINDGFKQGIFKNGFYENEWLNLYCKFPSHMQVDDDSIALNDKYNLSRKSKGLSILDMDVGGNDGKPRMFVEVMNKNGQTIEQYVNETKDILEKSYADLKAKFEANTSGEYHYSIKWDNPEKITFAGEEYTSYKFTTSSQQLIERVETKYSTNHILLREKGNRIIQISFSGQKDEQLTEMRECFTPYENNGGYCLGTVTTELYKSEWIGVNIKIPYSISPSENQLAYDLKVTNNNYNSARKDVCELSAYAGGQHIYVNVLNSDGKTVEQYEKDQWDEYYKGWQGIKSGETFSVEDCKIGEVSFKLFKHKRTDSHQSKTDYVYRLHTVKGNRRIIIRLIGTQEECDEMLTGITPYTK